MLPLLAFCLIQPSLTSTTHAAQNPRSTQQYNREPRGFPPTVAIPVAALVGAGIVGGARWLLQRPATNAEQKKITIGVVALCFLIGIVEFAAYSSAHSANKGEMDRLLLPAPLPANASIDAI